jgi:hypothetical protein
MLGHEWASQESPASEPIDDRAPRRHRELIAALEWLPVASLILADDGTVLAANQAWGTLVGTSSLTNSDQGRDSDWLRAVWKADADALRAKLQAVAADGGTGSADVRLTGASRTRWSRWWWCAGPTGYLIVCASESVGPALVPGRRADDGAGDPAAISDTLDLVVHRLFGIGLGLQSVTSHADDVTAQRLQHVLDDLDELICDVRSAAVSLERPLHHR